MTDLPEMPDNPNPAKVKAVIADALSRLDPLDYAERVLWCQTHDAHGVRMFPSYDTDQIIEFRWGGRSLAMIKASDLCGDEPLNLNVVFNAEAPDDASSLTSGDNDD